MIKPTCRAKVLFTWTGISVRTKQRVDTIPMDDQPRLHKQDGSENATDITVRSANYGRNREGDIYIEREIGRAFYEHQSYTTILLQYMVDTDCSKETSINTLEIASIPP